MELQEAKSKRISKPEPTISDFLKENTEDFDLSNDFTRDSLLGWEESGFVIRNAMREIDQRD